jgi:hypothetical protein
MKDLLRFYTNKDGRMIKNHLEVSENDDRCIIHFMMDPFLELDMKDKNCIIDNLINYLYELWRYAEQKNQFIRGTSFDFLSIYLSIENIIKHIFIYDSSMSDKIFNSLQELRSKTKKSRIMNCGTFIYDFIESNRYSIDYFVSSINLKYWKDLEVIIRIADFFERYDIDYLYGFFYSIFSPFIDYMYVYSEYEDQYIDDFEDRLYQFYITKENKQITNKERLFELFSSCLYLIHDEFDRAIKYRKERLYDLFIDYDD